MTHSVVRIQTTNATLIFRSDSLGRRRQTERLLRTRNGSSRSLLRMQLCWEIIYNTSTAAVGKEERRRKRVSNAIDSGRRKMNARPSINRELGGLSEPSPEGGQFARPSPHRKFHRRARGALIRRRSSIERWKFGYVIFSQATNTSARTALSLFVVLASIKRDERATVEYGKSKIKVFLPFLERRRSREEENLIQVDYKGCSSSSPDTLSAIFPTIPFFSARLLAGNPKTRRHWPALWLTDEPFSTAESYFFSFFLLSLHIMRR